MSYWFFCFSKSVSLQVLWLIWKVWKIGTTTGRSLLQFPKRLTYIHSKLSACLRSLLVFWNKRIEGVSISRESLYLMTDAPLSKCIKTLKIDVQAVFLMKFYRVLRDYYLTLQSINQLWESRSCMKCIIFEARQLVFQIYEQF